MIRRGIGVGSFVSAGGAAPVDADAQAFIDAAGITDATQQSAINTLVTDLKGYGIWSKMKAIWPFVGGTSSSHKWNLKDPRDLDAAFRLVFSGGLTHNSNGITGNGTNGYCDTFLSGTNLTNNSTHISLYSRSNTDISGVDIGFSLAPVSGVSRRYLAAIKLSGSGYYDQYDDVTGRQLINMSSTNADGMFITTRTASNSAKSYRNTTTLGTNTSTITNTIPTSVNMVICARRDASVGVVNYSNRNFAFASIGDGLTDTEAANLYTAVQAYQTTLSRNV